MAKKKNKESSAGCLLVVVFIVTVIFTPVLLLFGSIISFLQLQALVKKLTGTISDFWLNDIEKTQYKDGINNIAKINNGIEDLIRKGNDAGIAKNNDGSFSRRSNLGKEIQGNLEKLTSLKDNLVPHVNALASLPRNRWNSLNSKAAMYKSCITGLIAWVLSLSVMSIYYSKSGIIDAVKPYYTVCHNIISDVDHKIQLQDGDISIMALNTIVGISVFIFCYFVAYKNAGAKYSPMPDIVTPNNYDIYNTVNEKDDSEDSMQNTETSTEEKNVKKTRPKWETCLIRFLAFMVLMVILLVIFAIISKTK